MTNVLLFVAATVPSLIVGWKLCHTNTSHRAHRHTGGDR